MQILSKRHLSAFVLVATALGTAATSQAALVPIANADFEANGPGFIQATSWVGTALVADHASFRNESVLFGGGAHFAFTQPTNDAAEQTLTTQYAADFDYTLSANLNYGTSDDIVDAVLELGYDAGAGFVSLGSTAIDLEAFNIANGGVPADGTAWALGTADIITVSAGSLAVGENIIIRIQSAVPGIENSGVWFDNVTLDAVPEPASLALLGLGGLAMLARRR